MAQVGNLSTATDWPTIACASGKHHFHISVLGMQMNLINLWPMGGQVRSVLKLQKRPVACISVTKGALNYNYSGKHTGALLMLQTLWKHYI